MCDVVPWSFIDKPDKPYTYAYAQHLDKSSHFYFHFFNPPSNDDNKTHKIYIALFHKNDTTYELWFDSSFDCENYWKYVDQTGQCEAFTMNSLSIPGESWSKLAIFIQRSDNSELSEQCPYNESIKCISLKAPANATEIFLPNDSTLVITSVSLNCFSGKN